MAKESTTTTFPINVENLKSELAKRNLSFQKASVESGHCKTYYGNRANLGSMTYSGAKLLEVLYNIKPESYKAEEKEEIVEKTVETPNDYDKLYDTIYRAVFDAMVKVWG